MKTTEFIKCLSENYKLYKWDNENGKVYAVKNNIRITILENYENFTIEINCKHIINIARNNEFYNIVKELYNNIISLMKEQEDMIISKYFDAFVNG